MTKLIPLTRGQFAIVDDADLEWLSQFKWCYVPNGNGRAVRTIKVDGKGFQLAMHRAIANLPSGMFVDHIDGNGLNNIRANLRICTPEENKKNLSAQRRDKSSRYKGVVKTKNRWAASIATEHTRTYLGAFLTEEAAAHAYDAAALQLHGEFARLNFPLDGNASAVVEMAQAAFETPLIEDFVSVLTSARILAKQVGDHHLLGEIQRVISRYNRTRNTF